MNNWNWIYIVILTTSLFSCNMHKATRGDVNYINPEITNQKELLESLRDSSLNAQYLYIKSKAKVELEDGEMEFRISTRMVKDSAIQIRIKKGIPIANVLITKDSIKVRNDLEKTILVEDYTYLEELIGYKLEFSILQNILIGSPYYYYEKDLYNYSEDKPYHLLTTVSKRKLKKQLEEDEDVDEINGLTELNGGSEELIIQALWFNGFEKKLSSMFLKDPVNNKKFWLNYSDELQFDNQSIPRIIGIDIKVKRGKKKSIVIEHVRAEIRTSLNLVFRVPSKYEVLD